MADDTHADGVHARHHRARNFLVRSTLALFSTSLVTSGLGFVYWTGAARLFSASDVGQATTAIAAMSLIGPFTVLGFGTTLVARLPTMRSGRAELVATAAAVCATVAIVLASVCAMVLPPAFLGLPGIGHDVATTAIFVGGVAAHSVGMMLDNALLSAIGGRLQLVRNTIHSVVKLILLVTFALVLHWFGGLSIYTSWFIAGVLSILVVGVELVRQFRIPLRRLLPRLSTLEGLHFHAAKHHLLNLSLSVPYYAMPIVANVILDSEQAGYNYATWSLAGFVFVLPMAMSMSLFASGSKDPGTVLRDFRFTLRASFAACLAANLVLLPFGGVVLGIFGPAYAANGRELLTVLCIGAFGVVIRDHHIVIGRVTGRVGREALMMMVLAAGEVTGAAIGAARGGLLGLGLGWAVAIAVEVVVCAPLVWRAYCGRLPSLSATAAAPAEPASH